MSDDNLEFRRETIEIEGGRKLYRYTFGVEGVVAPNQSQSAEPPKKPEPETKE